MFLDTAFLKNDEISLVLEKTTDAMSTFISFCDMWSERRKNGCPRLAHRT